MASLPCVTCRAHTRRSAAWTIAVSCVCRTRRRHRYLLRRPRRSMLLRLHARPCCLANCRSRAGSWLVAGWVGDGRKGTEPAHGSVLFQTASPPQHAKFHCMPILPRRSLAAYGRIPHHRTIVPMCSRESRSLMGGRRGSLPQKVYLPDCFLLLCFLTILYLFSAVTALLYHTPLLFINHKTFPNH